MAFGCGIGVRSRGGWACSGAPGAFGSKGFRIFLPVTEEPPEPETRDLPAAARGTETILLVEDEEHALDVTRRVLEESGYRVVAATSGADALARLEGAGDVDLLLTDVVMPGMDGQELACLATRARPRLRVVFLTGYDVALRPEAAAHLPLRKPAVPALLVHEVERALDRPAPARA